MKKSKTLKFALGVLVLCLITTCVMGTTLAKYTTGGTAADEARVAKWGVSVQMEADPLFVNSYNKTDAKYTKMLSVTSSDGNNVVAPGTDSTQANGSAVFTISGTPEVAVRVKIEMTNVKDVFLKAGTYNDPTVATGTFTLNADYYPVVFTLKQVVGENKTPLVTGTLAQVQTFLNAYNNMGANGTTDNDNNGREYKPNTVLDATFELSWAWAFGGNDKADTYLGNLMAGQNPENKTEGTDYCLNVKYDLSVTVEQVD